MSWMPQHIVCMYVGDKCTSERDSQRQPWRRSEEARGGPGSAAACPEGEEATPASQRAPERQEERQRGSGEAEAEQRQPEPRQRGRWRAEGLRRGRASPTPTGCTQSHPERPQGQGSPQGWTETPADTQHTLTTSTGAQERRTLPEVVRGYPGHPHATHSPSDAPRATTGGTGCGASTHRAKRATAARDDPQTMRGIPI